MLRSSVHRYNMLTVASMSALLLSQGYRAVALTVTVLCTAGSPGAQAQPRGQQDPDRDVEVSAGFCRVSSISRTAKVEQDGYTNLWLDVGAYVCGGEEPVIVTIDEQLSDIAIAVAEAFAEVSSNCFAQGNADIRAQGYAFAEERAMALGSAVSEIFATTEVCGECDIAISALSTVTEELFVEAIATAWFELYLFSDAGTQVSDQTTVTSSVIQSTIFTVLSNITGILRAGVDGDCSIEIINTAQVGPSLARCELLAAGVSTVVEVDAIAQAGAEAGAYACDGDIASAQVDVIAQATATAVAQAIADTYVFCESRGNALACGVTEVEVRAVAMAQAEAFASALAEAATCDCEVSLFASVEVWGVIWAEAAVNAYAETCSVGTGSMFDSDFKFAFEERMLTATARAIASAVAMADELEGSECRASVSVCASTSPECKENNALCGGGDIVFTSPCCDPNSDCIVQNARRFLCRNRSLPIPSFWDGTIAECTLPPPTEDPKP